MLGPRIVDPALESIVAADEELRARLSRVAQESRGRVDAAKAEIDRREAAAKAQYELAVEQRVRDIGAASAAEKQQRQKRRLQSIEERLATARAAMPAAVDAFVRLVREGPP